MVPPPSPQQMPQPYYGYPPQQPAPQARDMAALFTKRIVFFVVGIGAVLIWIDVLALRAFGVTDPGTANLLQAVGMTGALLGFGGSLLGSLGSMRTSGYQNLGLLVLAGVFVFIMIGL